MTVKTIADGIKIQFPTSDWDRRKMTDLALSIRDFLISGWAGGPAGTISRQINGEIGHESRNRVVSIPFRTSTGKIVTLFGGWIHASQWVTWDILDRDSVCGDYDDDRWPMGLSCLHTIDLIRAIRTL